MARVKTKATSRATKGIPVPPLRDTVPAGDHSEKTWAAAATIRKRLSNSGFALPTLRG